MMQLAERLDVVPSTCPKWSRGRSLRRVGTTSETSKGDRAKPIGLFVIGSGSAG
jgi:hypothetical protein